MVQVDPIKPMLKAPATKRLKLEYDELLSNVAFKSNLRHYIEERGAATLGLARGLFRTSTQPMSNPRNNHSSALSVICVPISVLVLVVNGPAAWRFRTTRTWST